MLSLLLYIVCFVIALAGFVSYGIIYRLTFHPLAKCPGPFIASITQALEHYHSKRGSKSRWLLSLHDKYGDVVRISPNSLSMRTAGALHDMYGDRKANLIKTGFWETSTHTAPAHIVSTADRQQHAAWRRLLSHAFSESAVQAAEQYILPQIRIFTEKLGESSSSTTWNQPWNIAQLASFLTLDVLGELCFGASFRAMQDGCQITDFLAKSATFQQSVAYHPFRHLLYPIIKYNWGLRLLYGDAGAGRIELFNTAQKCAAERLQLETAIKEKPEKEERKDFSHYLLQAEDTVTNTKLTPQQIGSQAVIMIGAGTDTTATAISATLYYLLHNPHVLMKLQSQIRSTFSDVEEIVSGPELSGLTYLRACCDESLRMSPPVPGILSRLVLEGGAEIDGTTYPAGTVVGVSAYVIHHNPEYFPRPFSYIPERWLDPTDERNNSSNCNHPNATGDNNISTTPFPITHETVEHAKSAFCPFSIGTRGCIAKNLAYLELTLTIARTLYLYDMKLVADHTEKGKEDLKDGRLDTDSEVTVAVAVAVAVQRSISSVTNKEEPRDYDFLDRFVMIKDGPVVQFSRPASVASTATLPAVAAS